MREALTHLSDDQWHAMLVRSLAGPVDGISLPGFPSADTQSRISGSANETTLWGANRFYRTIKQQAGELGSPLNPTSRILDFGIGWGRIARFFLKDLDRGGIYGVDVNPKMLDLCWETKVPATIALIHPRGSLPYRDGLFDCVYAFSVFTHLPEPVQNIWLAEIARVLKPGGVFVATVEPPRFIDFVYSIDPAKAEHPWHRNLATAVKRAPNLKADFAARGFAFMATVTPPEEDPADADYGDTVISEAYIRRYWGRIFSVHQYIDEGEKFRQVTVVCQKH